MKKINIIFLFFVFVLSACKKSWLEEKADISYAVPGKLKDFQALLDNTLLMNNYVSPSAEISTDGFYITESAWTNASSNAARNAYTWTNDLPYRDLFDWIMTYSRIFNNNIVLEGLDKIKTLKPSEQDIWNDIKGQALFNRSSSFYNLAQIYALPFNASTAETDPGIPLRLNTDIIERSVRFSVKQTYDQIITDLKEAADLLPATSSYPTRGSKNAAYALLARAYLSMENYDSALSFAQKALEINNHLMNYNEYDNSQENFGLFPPEVVFHDVMYTDDVAGFLTYNYLVDTALYNTYDQNDLRKMLFFSVNPDGSVFFKGNYNNNSGQLFCGIANDELYLIIAECYARKAEAIEAMNYLNMLLEKRWDNSVPFPLLTATDAEQALTIILSERRKELLLRNLRWADLRRLNKDERFKVILSRTIGEKTYTLEPGSYKYTFPIPDDIIEFSGMSQTPGWK